MRIHAFPSLLVALAAGAAFAANAQPAMPGAPMAGPAVAAVITPTADPATELLRNARATITQGDYDAELSRLPPDMRPGFGTDITRINTLLSALLVNKTLSVDARAAGLDRDPEFQRRVALETERLLAQILIQKLDDDAAKEFDARPGMEVAARERWLTQPDKYRASDQVQVTHILFEVPKHKREEAQRLAQDARAKIVAGADMNALAKEISEDPSAQQNGGRLDWRSREQLDPQFARAAFALAKPGELSPPIQSKFGIHVIRLDDKRAGGQRTFASVKDSIIAEMRRAYVEQKKIDRFAVIRNDPAIVVNEPAVEALVKRVDPELLRKATEDATAAAAQRAAQPKDTSPVVRPR
jgi:peptidyl-prolyl cis-trans isomerase C